MTRRSLRVLSGGALGLTLAVSFASHHAELWEKVVRKLRAGVMPPPDLRPSLTEYEGLRGDAARFESRNFKAVLAVRGRPFPLYSAPVFVAGGRVRVVAGPAAACWRHLSAR